MSYVFNMGGGGTGLSDANAFLTVTVLAESTVTITKNGITLIPTIWLKADDDSQCSSVFMISPSFFDSEEPWTVTVLINDQTLTAPIIIDTNKAYDLRLGKITLYNNGTLARGYSYSASGSTNNYQIDVGSLYLHSVDPNAYGRIGITPAIDLTNISKIRFNIYRNDKSVRGAWVGISNDPAANSAVASIDLKSATAIGSLDNGVWMELDVSEITGSWYVELYSDTTYGDSMQLRVYGIELTV